MKRRSAGMDCSKKEIRRRMSTMVLEAEPKRTYAPGGLNASPTAMGALSPRTSAAWRARKFAQAYASSSARSKTAVMLQISILPPFSTVQRARAQLEKSKPRATPRFGLSAALDKSLDTATPAMCRIAPRRGTHGRLPIRRRVAPQDLRTLIPRRGHFNISRRRITSPTRYFFVFPRM